MEFDTIKFYLENLPKEVKLIVSSNSNISVSDLLGKSASSHDTEFRSVISDKFPIPKYFDLVFSTVQIPYFSNWRHKTCVWFKKS